MNATMLLVADEPLTMAGPTQLIAAALVGIAAIVAPIVWGKVHPFLAPMLGSAVLALTAGIALTDTFTAFTAGVGSIVGEHCGGLESARTGESRVSARRARPRIRQMQPHAE